MMMVASSSSARNSTGRDAGGDANAAVGMAAAPVWPLLPATSPPPPMSSTGFAAPSAAQQQQQSADWPCIRHWLSCSGGPSEAGWAADNAVLQEDDTIQLLPLSPDDLQRLQGVDPVVVDTILLLLSNLQDNLFD